jgi:hypothetical protein
MSENWVLVSSLEHFKVLSTNQRDKDILTSEFYIILAGGLARSCKRAYTIEGLFTVYNESDDTWQEDLTEEQLHTQTMIPEAIEKGVFYFSHVDD